VGCGCQYNIGKWSYFIAERMVANQSSLVEIGKESYNDVQKP